MKDLINGDYLEATDELNAYKAIIRVVKTLNQNEFMPTEAVREKLIYAKDKAEVKQFLLKKYPQFFQNSKVYEKSTKDEAQFFYVIIYPLYDYEKQKIKDGEWVCCGCSHIHKNKYLSPPYYNSRLNKDNIFCNEECFEHYKEKNAYSVNGREICDDENYIKSDSLNYIYKITEKASNKSYIGKTKNAPFFRWWNHLTHSISPFGLYLQSTKLSEWTFEVLEELPADMEDSNVFKIESDYIVKYDSIKNGFNSLISNKSAKKYIEDTEDNK